VKAGAGRDPKAIDEITKVFKEFDADGDGRLTLTELMNVLKKSGKSASKFEMKMLMNQADKDRNGVITLDEFIAYMTAPETKIPNDSQLKARFGVFDKDGDGFITREEMTSIVAELGMTAEWTPKAIDALFSEADSNGDGMIDFDEFSAVFK
jgi:Ca2+-binding EF-hand superfamily protein